MNFLRKAFIGLGTPALAVLVTAGVVLLSLNMAFHTSANIKKWLAASDLYSHAVNAILDQSTKDTGSSSGGLSLSQPEVQAVFKQVVTPAFLQKNIEIVIDGSYTWLQGKTTKPTYNIDLSPIKTAFADALEASARQRLATLPACSYRNIPTTTDPFSVTCNPPAALVNADVAQLRNDIINGQSFLPQSAITADTTSIGNADNNGQSSGNTTTASPQEPVKPWYQQATQVPTIYKLAYYGPMIFGVLALLIAVVIIFSARTRRNGMRIVSSSILSAGILLGVTAAASLFTFNQLIKSVKLDSSPNSIQEPAMDAARLAGSYVTGIQLRIGIALAAFGIIALIVLYVTRPKVSKPDAPQTPKETTTNPPVAN